VLFDLVNGECEGLALGRPGDFDLSVLSNAVSQIEVDEALVGVAMGLLDKWRIKLYINTYISGALSWML